jgi:hypothetical protein
MQYFLLICFNNKPLHVSSNFAVNYQEDKIVYIGIVIVMRYAEWLLGWSGWNKKPVPSRSCQQPVIIMHDISNYSLYRVDHPDDEQQACSKRVEAYYWNNLIENSASCCFMLHRYNTMHSQQNILYLIHSFLCLQRKTSRYDLWWRNKTEQYWIMGCRFPTTE